MFDRFDPADFLMQMSALILGITIHEWAHAIVADKLGDDTPRSQGRVTLWPLAHLDPIGTLMMAITTITGVGFGWGRPVMTNPRNYTMNRRVADSLVSIAGPISNIVIVVFFAALLRADLTQEAAWVVWMHRIVLVNIGLFLFNLLPIYPLDGSHLMANALPPPLADGYRRFMSQFGTFIFLALVFTKAFSVILVPALLTVYMFLVGPGNP